MDLPLESKLLNFVLFVILDSSTPVDTHHLR